MTVATFRLYFKVHHLMNDVFINFFRAKLEPRAVFGAKTEDITHSVNPFGICARYEVQTFKVWFSISLYKCLLADLTLTSIPFNKVHPYFIILALPLLAETKGESFSKLTLALDCTGDTFLGFLSTT